jgi:hypothetical protein
MGKEPIVALNGYLLLPILPSLNAIFATAAKRLVTPEKQARANYILGFFSTMPITKQ